MHEMLSVRAGRFVANDDLVAVKSVLARHNHAPERDKLKLLGSGIGQRLARIKYGEETVKQSMLYYQRFKARQDRAVTSGAWFSGMPRR